jgi:hypothetical protein
MSEGDRPSAAAMSIVPYRRDAGRLLDLLVSECLYFYVPTRTKSLLWVLAGTASGEKEVGRRQGKRIECLIIGFCLSASIIKHMYRTVSTLPFASGQPALPKIQPQLTA